MSTKQENSGSDRPEPEAAERVSEEVAEEVTEEGVEQQEQSTDEAFAALQEDLVHAREDVLRAQAEMQNLRRRAERDVENAHKYALDKFVGELLPVVDNLERALAADSEGSQAVLEGIELTLKSFMDVLKRFNVEQIDPHGQPFDPGLHQAMSMVPNPDMEPNTVMEVFQKGYTLNGRLVRPAMVVVARNE